MIKITDASIVTPCFSCHDEESKFDVTIGNSSDRIHIFLCQNCLRELSARAANIGKLYQADPIILKV